MKTTDTRIIEIALHHDNTYTYYPPTGSTGRDPRYSTSADAIAAAKYVYGADIGTKIVLAP